METPYRAVSFSDTTKDAWELVTKSDLNQVQANLQWIKENTPRVRFWPINGSGGSGTPIDNNISIVGGKAKIPYNKKEETASVAVKFKSNTFRQGAYPHITTGVISNWQDRIHCVVTGPGNTYYPTYQGFRIRINVAADLAKNDKILKDLWVCWIAYAPAPPSKAVTTISTPIPKSNPQYPNGAKSGAVRTVME